MIVTPRDPAWGGAARPVELAVWSEEEGADFLASRLPSGAARSDLKRLSRALGGLQLALEQAAAFLEVTLHGSAIEYRKQVEGVDTVALVLDEGRASMGYERSVLATLSLAFPHLTPAARQIVRVCAFFSAEPISERYFRERTACRRHLCLLRRPRLSDGSALLEICAASVLLSASTCSLESPDSTEKALVFHRLTLEVARHARVRPPRTVRWRRTARAHCPVEGTDIAGWPHLSALLPHLSNIERLRPQGWLNRRRHSLMLDIAAAYLRAGKGLYRESENLLRTALGIWIEPIWARSTPAR